jgi:YfiH family protein
MKENKLFVYYKTDDRIEVGFSNKNFLFDSFFKDKKYAILKQIHSNIVLNISTPVKFSEGDGLITNKRDLYLIVKTADCYPVIAYNLEAGYIAVLHAGWRGVYKNIFKEFKKKAIELGADKRIIEDKTRFIIGPGICGKCYEVNKGFYYDFKKTGIGDEFFRINDDSAYFYIRGAIERRLLKLNFDGNNIKNIDLCTYETQSLFSYRRDKTKERLYNFIRLK